MPIKNYTTSVAVIKTVGEISGILAGAGCQAVQIEYEDREPSAVSFRYDISGDGEVTPAYFRLPSNPEGVLTTMIRDGVPPRYRNLDHAKRVGWRIVKDWVDAQMALVYAGQAEIAEVFLPYMQVFGGGEPRALYQQLKEAPERFLIPETVP